MAQHDIATIYDEYFDSVYRYVAFRVRTSHDAEDIVADVFMKVVAKIDSYKKQRGASVKSWIFTITRNTLIDYYRKSGKQVVSVEEVEVADDSRGMDELVDVQLSVEQLQEHVDSLPERQKEILLLRYTADMKNTEIAATLDINEKSVSAALSKATKQLRVAITNAQL